ncbi:MAG: TIGR02594 family protein [Methylococcaceae bacterium]|nr:MAG: TIGR02594 family protein [Methylococcaceae bacterium]
MTRIEELRNVPKDDLKEKIENYEYEGATVSVIHQSDGHFTIRAIFSVESNSDTNAPLWYSIAKRELSLDVKEIIGHKNNPRIVAYHDTVSLSANDDETPWCSSFVNYCVKEAGLEGTNSAAALSWINWGKELDQPTTGCIVVLKRPESGPTAGHVGFYVGKTNSEIYLLGGNQGNKVCIAPVNKNRVINYRWPKDLYSKKADINMTTANAISPSLTADKLVDNPKIKAMLDVLAFTEGTGNDYGKVVNGTVISAPYNPELVGRRNVSVTNFNQHPNILVQVNATIKSTAAGRYQFLKETWDELDMPNFQPRNQDIAAVKLMKKRGMIELLLADNLQDAVFRGAPEWASLPKDQTNRGYYGGQVARTIAAIEQKYTDVLTEILTAPLS